MNALEKLVAANADLAKRLDADLADLTRRVGALEKKDRDFAEACRKGMLRARPDIAPPEALAKFAQLLSAAIPRADAE